jgi:hypothetical protein
MGWLGELAGTSSGGRSRGQRRIGRGAMEVKMYDGRTCRHRSAVQPHDTQGTECALTNAPFVRRAVRFVEAAECCCAKITRGLNWR